MNRRDFLQFAVGLITTRLLMTQSVAPNKPKKHSLKGWERYSWRDQKSWKFLILIGTNRNKKLEEIIAPKIMLHSLKELEQALSKLAKDEYITWFDPPAIPELSLPPITAIENTALATTAQV